MKKQKEYDFSKGRRGPVVSIPAGKTRITIRIDDEVLYWFRRQVNDAGGGSYQNSINRALREHMEREAEPLEDTLRRVLREVLPPLAAKKAKARKKTARKKTA